MNQFSTVTQLIHSTGNLRFGEIALRPSQEFAMVFSGAERTKVLASFPGILKASSLGNIKSF